MNNNIFEFLYDTITFANTAVTAGAKYQMFSVPFDGTNKQKWQTNQFKANQCQYTAMNIVAIYFKVFTNSVSALAVQDDVEKIIKNSTLTIYKNTVPVLQTPLSKIGGGNQLDGFIANTNNSSLSICRNGAGHMDNMFKLAGSSTGAGIPFVENEQLDIVITAETTFTPSGAVYGQLGLLCDTWQNIN